MLSGEIALKYDDYNYYFLSLYRCCLAVIYMYIYTMTES